MGKYPMEQWEVKHRGLLHCVIDDRGGRVADMYSNFFSRDVLNRRINLIVAAPDLLNACEAVVEALEPGNPHYLGCGFCFAKVGHNGEWCPMPLVQAAITKAKREWHE